MRHVHCIVLACGFIAFGVPAAAQTKESTTLELLRHIASMPGQSQADVFSGRLPDTSINVPLPKAAVLGSIVKHYIPPAYGAPETDVYYDGGAAEFEAYASALEKAGWIRKQTPYEDSTRGGFQASPPVLEHLYCRGNEQIEFSVVPRTRDLRVTLYGGPLGNMMCGMNPATYTAQNPLPTLMPRAGESMTVSAGATPATGALFRGTQSIAELLQNFSDEFQQAGWTPEEVLLTHALASRSFHITDEKGDRWQAVLTLYIVDGEQNTAIGFIDLTNLAHLPEAR